MTTEHSGGHKHAPAGPFIIDTRQLGHVPGALREVRRTVPAPADFGIGLITVVKDTPIDLDVRLEAVTEGVLVSGHARALAQGECGRCLDPVSLDLDVELMELFAYPGSSTEETTDEDEVYRLIDDRADLEQTVRNAIVLALPLSPLCSEDCQGLCPGCGQRNEDLPADHSHEQIDPRWSGLQNKFGNLEQ